MSESIIKAAPANFTLYPLLWLAICFALGILAGNYFAFQWRVYLIIGSIFSVFTIIFLKQKFALVSLFFAFAAAGAMLFQIENSSTAQNHLKNLFDQQHIKSGDPIEIEGVLQSAPELSVGGFFLELKIEKVIYKGSEIKVLGKIRLFATSRDEETKNQYEQLNLRYGSQIRVACNLRREDKFLNPGAVSQIELLDQKGIDATGIIKSPLLVEKIAEMETFAPLAWLYERRQNLTIDFRDKFSVSTAGIMIASLLGNKYFLDKPTAEVFREGGTFHVLVISGLHITFIGSLTLLFIRFFTNKRLWQFLIAGAFLWAYSIAVGAEVPVVRAALMFTILLFSQVIYRSGTLLNSLGACALILLVWRPNDLFTQSFQLTFVSITALVAMAFPLIEKLRAIGSWSPSAENPFPPNASRWLRRFCETIYWRKKVWEFEGKQQIWSAKIFKSPYLKWLEAKGWQGILRFVFEAILVSLIVQIWLLPLLIFYFHRLSVASIFLNLYVGIIIALESFAALIALFLANLSSFLALPLIKLTEFLNWLLTSVPGIFVENDWASLRLPIYSGAMKAIYILYFLPVVVLALLLNCWKPFALNSKLQVANFTFSVSQLLRAVASLFLLFFALIVFHPFSAPIPDGRLHIDFLDVGQGDSALITFPNGETMLVDGGGKVNFNKIYLNNETEDEPELFEPDTQTVGEAVVSQFLWEKGYSKIDYILATHADADHIQGLADVAKNFHLRAAMFGRTPIQDADFAELYVILKKRGIELVTLSRGDVLSFGNVKIEMLYPKEDDSSEALSDNNHSIVLRLIYGERKFLLTGDVEKEAERELLNTPEFLQADVVKVAHHGSRTSSTQDFINALQAKVAVISVGKESPFGHPHAEVVERWRDSGAKILTTGENGTISISTDGKDLQIKTFHQATIFR
jgi:competence protein ComEC